MYPAVNNLAEKTNHPVESSGKHYGDLLRTAGRTWQVGIGSRVSCRGPRGGAGGVGWSVFGLAREREREEQGRGGRVGCI